MAGVVRSRGLATPQQRGRRRNAIALRRQPDDDPMRSRLAPVDRWPIPTPLRLAADASARGTRPRPGWPFPDVERHEGAGRQERAIDEGFPPESPVLQLGMPYDQRARRPGHDHRVSLRRDRPPGRLAPDQIPGGAHRRSRPVAGAGFGEVFAVERVDAPGEEQVIRPPPASDVDVCLGAGGALIDPAGRTVVGGALDRVAGDGIGVVDADVPAPARSIVFVEEPAGHIDDAGAGELNP